MKIELRNDEIIDVLRQRYGMDATFSLYFNTKNKNGVTEFDVKIECDVASKYVITYPFLLGK